MATTTTSTGENPYQILIDSCDNDPQKLQEAYQLHRTTRSKNQISKFLDPDFKGVEIDPILYSLEKDEPKGFVDPRNCLVFWARPTETLKGLVGEVQRRLAEKIPDLYCQKQQDLHMTALEITHSRTAEEIENLVKDLLPQMETMIDLPRAKGGVLLGRPMVSFDAQALALSFLPLPDLSHSSTDDDDNGSYTYHHLRRDLWDLASEKVSVGSRYVVPSAHITLGRFLGTGVEARAVVEVVEGINAWLDSEFGGAKGEWRVGEEVGLCYRKGRLWYGGGETVGLGNGL